MHIDDLDIVQNYYGACFFDIKTEQVLICRNPNKVNEKVFWGFPDDVDEKAIISVTIGVNDTVDSFIEDIYTYQSMSPFYTTIASKLIDRQEYVILVPRTRDFKLRFDLVGRL